MSEFERNLNNARSIFGTCAILLGGLMALFDNVLRIGYQLVHRFGPLPDHARERLDRASTEQLDAWALRVLDLATLDAVLAT